MREREEKESIKKRVLSEDNGSALQRFLINKINTECKM